MPHETGRSAHRRFEAGQRRRVQDRVAQQLTDDERSVADHGFVDARRHEVGSETASRDRDAGRRIRKQYHCRGTHLPVTVLPQLSNEPGTSGEMPRGIGRETVAVTFCSRNEGCAAGIGPLMQIKATYGDGCYSDREIRNRNAPVPATP